MAEFTIKGEDLNSLKGKVAIVTGVLLHSRALRVFVIIFDPY